MKERDFYKKVMERSFEPDFDKLSETILSTPEDNAAAEKNAEPSRSRVRFSFVSVAAACLAGILGVGIMMGLNALNRSDMTVDSLSERADDISAVSAPQTEAPADSDESSQEDVADEPYIYYNDEYYHSPSYSRNHFYLSEGKKPPIPAGSEFLGLVTYNSLANGKKNIKLETNCCSVGSAAFYFEPEKAIYVWEQKEQLWGDLYIFSLYDYNEYRRIEKTGIIAYAQQANGETYTLYDAIEAEVVEIAEEESTDVEPIITLEINRRTLKTPNDPRIPDIITAQFSNLAPAYANELKENEVCSARQLHVGDTIWIDMSSDYASYKRPNLRNSFLLYEYENEYRSMTLSYVFMGELDKYPAVSTPQ